jgi:hypothetical protein
MRRPDARKYTIHKEKNLPETEKLNAPMNSIVFVRSFHCASLKTSIPAAFGNEKGNERP